MTAPATPGTDPIQAAIGLRDEIREAAPQIEAERRLPRSLVESMRAAGLFHVYVPRDYDGLEADPVTGARAVEETAYADGSAGWCSMIAAQTTASSGALPREEAERVFGHRQICAGVARPIGRAVAQGDSFRVTGRWPFASGSSHADWLCGECVIYDGETPRKTPAGDQVTRMLFFPAGQATIHDTWYTTGLRGTASNDFSVEDIEVPATRGFQMIVDPPVHPWPLFRAMPMIFVTHGAHAVGVGRAAIDSAKEIASTKIGWGTDKPMSHNPRVQHAFAEAIISLESARSYMYTAAEEAWQRMVANDAELARPVGRMRLATSHAATAAVHATDIVHDLMATSAIFTSSPLERQFRDIHTAAAHVMIGPLTYEAGGRVELGLPAEMPLFV